MAHESKLRENLEMRTGKKATDILTPEEKSSYRKFGQKIHSIDDQSLMMLNMNMADQLTSEMKDIVSFEIKLREHEFLKKANINPEEEFSIKNRETPEPDPNFDENYTDVEKRSFQALERNRQAGMTDDLLERSKKIIENAYLEPDMKKLNNPHGGGINAMWKKYLIESDNGTKIKVNNEAIQERFRKAYLIELSKATGIDYTVLDPTINIDLKSDTVESEQNQRVKDYMEDVKVHGKVEINPDEYEDDDD